MKKAWIAAVSFVVPSPIRWSDLGAWDAVWKESDADDDGNVTRGPVSLFNSRNSFVLSEGTHVAVNGVEDAVVVCQALTTKLLLPGECEIVVCNAELKGGGNIFVDVDPEDIIADCHPGNNLGAGALGICPG